MIDISEAAVEAAAKAMFESDHAFQDSAGKTRWQWTWKLVPIQSDAQKYWLATARTGLLASGLYAAGCAAQMEADAKVADAWATPEQRQHGNGGPGAAIRASAEPKGGKGSKEGTSYTDMCEQNARLQADLADAVKLLREIVCDCEYGVGEITWPPGTQLIARARTILARQP